MKTPEVKPSGGSYWREAAKWLVANGGSCRVASNKAELEVKTEKEIPAGKFDIVELTFDRLVSPGAPPTDADFKVFNGIKTLRRVWVRTTGLGDEAFLFLAANPELAWINLEGVADLTDGVLLHFANGRKLGELPDFRSDGLHRKRPGADALVAGAIECGLSRIEHRRRGAQGARGLREAPQPPDFERHLHRHRRGARGAGVGNWPDFAHLGRLHDLFGRRLQQPAGP